MKIKKDFLDVLLTARDENGVGMTDKEIQEETDTFLFAGFKVIGVTVYVKIFF